MPAPKQIEKTIDQLSVRLKKYAEILAIGTKTKLQAAIEAGFTPKVAHKKAFAWVGDSRQNSKYPALFDYYTELYKKHQRLYEADKQNVVRELSLLAFSDVTRFIDLPSKDYDDKRQRAVLIEEAVFICAAWDNWIKYKAEEAKEDPKKKKTRFVMEKPREPSHRHYAIVEEYHGMSDEDRASVMVWKWYQSGSIRLKNREDIPKELLPQIAEISNTRDGIKLKLHSKTDALDKLARILKMYDEDKSAGDNFTNIQQINLIVNGSKSSLLSQDISKPPEE